MCYNAGDTREVDGTWLDTFATARAASSLPATDVFLLKNDKGEWIMPKGVIRDRRRRARSRALPRGGRSGHPARRSSRFVGRTSYDFYLPDRGAGKFPTAYSGSPCARRDRRYRIAFEQGFLDGDYFAFDVAVRLLTHEQDREILRQAQKLVAASENAE